MGLLNATHGIFHEIRVGIGEMAFSKSEKDILSVYGLGSCVCLVLFDPETKVGGLAHIQFPSTSQARSSANSGTATFADKAVPAILRSVTDLGARKRRIQVGLVGGASVLDPSHFFQIGKSNYLAVRKLLWRESVMLSFERVGGTRWRTVKLFVGTGKVRIQSPDGVEEL